MIGRLPLLAALVASLALAGPTSAHGSHRDAAIAGAVVGAVIGGVIVANSRYGRVPVHVEIGAPPPPVYYEPYPVYYEPYPVYYEPYPVVVVPRYKHKHHHHKHYRRYPDYYAPRW